MSTVGHNLKRTNVYARISNGVYEEIICSGFGGQGILFMGKLIAQASLLEGKNVTWMPSYGAEVRGGTAHSMVVISSDGIAVPVVRFPDTCFAMNEPSFRRFEGQMKKGGLMIVNTSLIVNKKNTRNDIELLNIPLTDIAISLGNVRVANMVALGAYIAKKKSISLKSIVTAMKDLIPAYRHHMLGLNEMAIREGMRYGQGSVCSKPHRLSTYRQRKNRSV